MLCVNSIAELYARSIDGIGVRVGAARVGVSIEECIASHTITANELLQHRDKTVTLHSFPYTLHNHMENYQAVNISKGVQNGSSNSTNISNSTSLSAAARTAAHSKHHSMGNGDVPQGVTLYRSELTELYGASQSGKTECIYQGVLSIVLPVTIQLQIPPTSLNTQILSDRDLIINDGTGMLVSKMRRVTILLKPDSMGMGRAVVIDLDHRFSAARIQELVLSHIHNCVRHQLTAALNDVNVDVIDEVSQRYLESSECADLIEGALSRVILLYASTHLELASAMSMIDSICITHNKAKNGPVVMESYQAIELESDSLHVSDAPSAASISAVSATMQCMEQGIEAAPPTKRHDTPAAGAHHTASSTKGGNGMRAAAADAQWVKMVVVEHISAHYWMIRNTPLPPATTSSWSDRSASSSASILGNVDGELEMNDNKRWESNMAAVNQLYGRIADLLKELASKHGFTALISKPIIFNKHIKQIADGFAHSEYLGDYYGRSISQRVILRQSSNIGMRTEKESDRHDVNITEALVVHKAEYKLQTPMTKTASLKFTSHATGVIPM